MGNKNSTPTSKTSDIQKYDPSNGIINSSSDKKPKKNKSFRKSKKDETDSPLKNGNSKSKISSSKDKENSSKEKPTYYSDTIFRSPQHKPDNPGEKQLSKVILPEQELDLKIYKRSREGLDNTDSRSNRSRSLPRSRSAALRKSTDTLLSSECRQRQQRYSSFAANGNVSFNSRWSSIVGSDSPADFGKPIGLQGVIFPPENVILSNQTTFEQSYVDCLVNQYYKSLPQVVQLSAIIIGYRRLITKNERTNEEVNINYEPINLWQYFNCTHENWIPEDLITPQASEWFISAIPVNLLTGLVHLRKEGGNEANVNEQLNLCIEIVRCVSFEATKEISRIYEYQISVVPDQGSVQQLGRHAAERSVEYLRSGNRFVERDSLIEGVAYLPPDALTEELGGFVSAIFGNEREVQWDIRRVFCCCGLRIYNFNDLLTLTSANDCFLSPPNFYTTRECMPLVYGYRGVIHKRNIETGNDAVSLTDINLFSDRLDENLDDFHRDYIPLSEMKRMKTAMLDTTDVSDILRRNNNLNINNYKYYDNNQNSRFPTPQPQQVSLQNVYSGKVIGRQSKQSTSTLIPENANPYRYSLSISTSNRSSILTNPNYNSLARSIDLGNGYDRTSLGSQSFQRDAHCYKSERIPPIGGGRLSKYVPGHPNRIPLNNEEINRHSYANQTSGRHGPVRFQGQLANCNSSRPIETSFEYEGNGDLVVTNHKEGFNRYHSVCQTDLDNNHNNFYANRPHSAWPVENGVKQNFNTVAKLPPKPPIRTISSSHYNSHSNFSVQQHQNISTPGLQLQQQQQQFHQQQKQPQRQFLSHQTLPQLSVEQQPVMQQQIIPEQFSSSSSSSPKQQSSSAQPSTSQMQHQIQQQQTSQQVLQQQSSSSQQQQKNVHNSNNVNNDFLDFNSFLRLVEQQNANLDSFEQKILQNKQQQQQLQQPQVLSNGVMSHV